MVTASSRSVVLQNVRVLGMDLNANPTSTQPAVASTATLEVGVLDAEKLALAGQTGAPVAGPAPTRRGGSGTR